jgi:hypothetical protein
MWDTLERARRLLLRDGSSSGRDPRAGERDPREPGDHLTDLTFALGRAELERLISALEPLPGSAGRADTPARLATALGQAIAHVEGRGRPSVTRQPAGLYTPEAWRINVEGADGTTRTAIERAIRNGSIES